MKKFNFLIFSMFFIIVCTFNVFAANPQININIYAFEDFSIEVKYGNEERSRIYPDGKSFVILMINGDIISDADALIREGHTLVPLRVISERLGANVEWNSDERSVDIWQNENYIKMYVDDNNLYLNNETIYTEVSPQIINSMTYVPLRLIGEAFGANVGYYSGFSNNSPNVFPVVWISNKTDKINISKEDAIKTAENIFFEFLSSFYDDNTIIKDNFSEKMLLYSGYNLKYNIKYISDFGEYYYIKFSDDLPHLGILIDKYDRNYYTIGAYSECLLWIDDNLKPLGWAMPH